MENCALMSSGENKLIRRRLAGAWLSSVISITLVLLLVGVASLLLVNAKSVSDYFKENVQVSVLMRPDVTEDEAMNYATTLDAMPFIKGTRFISKEEGTRDMTDMLGEDFLSVFETAPIPVSVDVTLKADYVSADSLELIKKAIGSSPLVDEVVEHHHRPATALHFERIGIVHFLVELETCAADSRDTCPACNVAASLDLS